MEVVHRMDKNTSIICKRSYRPDYQIIFVGIHKLTQLNSYVFQQLTTMAEHLIGRSIRRALSEGRVGRYHCS